MGNLRIRQGNELDLEAMAALRSQAWRQSYDFAEEHFQQEVAGQGERMEQWRAFMRDGAYFWVVIDIAAEDKVVGLSHASFARDTDAPNPLELVLLYLLDEAKGTGVADALMKMTLGDAPAHLWMLQDNPRAQAFYQRHGFTLDGTDRDSIVPGYRDVRLVRS